MPEQNRNKPNYIEKKKSNVKTESPLAKQKRQGNLTSSRFRRKMLTIQANYGAKSKIELMQPADLRTFSLVNKCIEIFTDR